MHYNFYCYNDILKIDSNREIDSDYINFVNKSVAYCLWDGNTLVSICVLNILGHLKSIEVNLLVSKQIDKYFLSVIKFCLFLKKAHYFLFSGKYTICAIVDSINIKNINYAKYMGFSFFSDLYNNKILMRLYYDKNNGFPISTSSSCSASYGYV